MGLLQVQFTQMTNKQNKKKLSFSSVLIQQHKSFIFILTGFELSVRDCSIYPNKMEVYITVWCSQYWQMIHISSNSCNILLYSPVDESNCVSKLPHMYRDNEPPTSNKTSDCMVHSVSLRYETDVKKKKKKGGNALTWPQCVSLCWWGMWLMLCNNRWWYQSAEQIRESRMQRSRGNILNRASTERKISQVRMKRRRRRRGGCHYLGGILSIVRKWAC